MLKQPRETILTQLVTRPESLFLLCFCFTVNLETILWMDEIRSHHLETMVETIICWYLRWGIESEARVPERWCLRGFRNHPQYVYISTQLLLFSDPGKGSEPSEGEEHPLVQARAGLRVPSLHSARDSKGMGRLFGAIQVFGHQMHGWICAQPPTSGRKLMFDNNAVTRMAPWSSLSLADEPYPFRRP